MRVTNEFRRSVVDELIVRWDIFEGTAKRFANIMNIPEATFSTIKTRYNNSDHNYEMLLKAAKWIGLGRQLGVYVRSQKWNVAETDVFLAVKEEIMFCKEESRSMMFVDDADIGKSKTAKTLAAQLPETYYIDCSIAKGKGELLRLMARTIGLEYKGMTIAEVFDMVVYGLTHNDRPVVILDEMGDLSNSATLEIKALWNATEHSCGWYAMGADGLRAKFERGYNKKRLGYAELLRRFNSKFSSVVPKGAAAKKQFYEKMIRQVLMANMKLEQRYLLDKIVKQCLENHGQDRMGCLTRAENLLILYTRPELTAKED